MSDIKLGVLLWNQAPAGPNLDAAARVDRLGYSHLWAWDHLYAIFGDPTSPSTRAGRACGVRDGDGADPPRPPRRRQHVPQPGPRGQARLDARPHLRRARDPRARGRLDGARAHGPRHRVRHGLRAAARLARRGGGRLPGPARWQVGHLGARRALPVRRPAPRADAGAGPPADHDRRQRREEDPAHRRQYADMWNGMGPLEVVTHKVQVLRQHCEDVGRDPSEIEFTIGCKVTIRDSEAEAVRVWKAAMEHNRTPLADVDDDRPSGTGRPSRSPSG